MNVELIDKIIAVIEQNPVNFNMSEWYDSDEDSPRAVPPTSDEVFECGATCCIAGWAEVLSGVWSLDHAETAAELLDLSGSMAYWLFYSGHWPEDAWFVKEGVDMDKPFREMEVASALALLRAIRDGRDPWEGNYSTTKIWERSLNGWNNTVRQPSDYFGLND